MLAASYITTRRRPTLPLASFPKHVAPWRLHATGRSRFSPSERLARFCRIGWDVIRARHRRSHARNSRAGRPTGGHGERSRQTTTFRAVTTAGSAILDEIASFATWRAAAPYLR